MIQSPLQLYDIKEQLIAYIVGDQPVGQKSYNVYIPLLEPFLPRDNKIDSYCIQYNGYINKGVKPKYNTVIKIKHTFNIPILTNAKIKSIIKDNKEIIPDNTKLICLCINKDINNIYIETSVE